MLVTHLEAEGLSEAPPGTHVILLSRDPLAGLGGRRLGLELRDTLLVLRPEGLGFAFLFRKPVEGTVAENVLRYGCGGLHIDACRVGGGDVLTGGGGKLWSHYRDHTSDRAAPRVNQGLGRWPSNLVLVHHAECRETGTRRVQGTSIPRDQPTTATRRSGVHSEVGGHQTIGRVQPVHGHADPDGLETITAWECQEPCPVGALDEQSGVLTTNPGQWRAPVGYSGGTPSGMRQIEHDSGGASRFFPQLKDEAELHGWLRQLVGDV